MLGDRVAEMAHPIEGEEPDAQGVHVVLVADALQEVIVGASVDVVVDALIELDELAHVGGYRDGVKVGDELIDDFEVVVGAPLVELLPAAASLAELLRTNATGAVAVG